MIESPISLQVTTFAKYMASVSSTIPTSSKLIHLNCHFLPLLWPIENENRMRENPQRKPNKFTKCKNHIAISLSLWPTPGVLQLK